MIIKKRAIYIANRIDEGEDENENPIDVYDKPFLVECTLNTLTSSTDVAVFGERVKRMSKTVLDYSYISKIHEKDLAYLYGANPDGEKTNGDNANYRIVAIMPQNLKIRVFFERLPDE